MSDRIRDVMCDDPTGIMNKVQRDILHCIGGNTSLVALRNISEAGHCLSGRGRPRIPQSDGVRRALFDEDMPRLLRRDLPEFEVRTVQEEGWSSLKAHDRGFADLAGNRLIRPTPRSRYLP
jgi:hypothetical protein